MEKAADSHSNFKMVREPAWRTCLDVALSHRALQLAMSMQAVVGDESGKKTTRQLEFFASQTSMKASKSRKARLETFSKVALHKTSSLMKFCKHLDDHGVISRVSYIPAPFNLTYPQAPIVVAG